MSNRWQQLGSDYNNGGIREGYGWSVDMSKDGNTLIVGNPSHRNDVNNTNPLRKRGKAYVYNTSNGNKIHEISGENKLDEAGYSVAISGNGSVFGVGFRGYDGNGNNNTGMIRLYNTTSGNQIGQDIYGETNALIFNVSINYDGSIIIIGEGATPNPNVGRVRVFSYNGNIWEQVGQNILEDGEGYMLSLIHI